MVIRTSIGVNINLTLHLELLPLFVSCLCITQLFVDIGKQEFQCRQWQQLLQTEIIRNLQMFVLLMS